MTASPRRPSPRPSRSAGAVAGLLAGAAAVLSAQATAAVLPGVTSPVLAVADRAVDATPRAVKEWAIETFGSSDKQVLVAGVVAVVALLAALAGALGARRPGVAVGAFVLLSGVAAAGAVTDRVATASIGLRLVPVLVLVVVGLGALVALLRPVRQPATAAADGARGSLDRRGFLRAAVVVGAVAAAGGLVSRSVGSAAAAVSRASVRIPRPSRPAPPVPPGASLDVPGLTPYLTPTKDFYRVDTALRVPDVPVDGWRLRVHGRVERPLELAFEDLLGRRLVERRITLTCVSNPVGGGYVGNATWIGVPVRDLLREAGVRPGSDAVRSTSADGWTAGTPLSALLDPARGALVAVAMNGEPLPLAHGFPARLVVPGLYGYVSATKWLTDLEVSRFADFEAYWTTRGYAARAPIKTASRIDVPRPFAHVPASRVPVAGVAWAQDRGIDRVEVRVDDGAWQQARLAAEDGIDTWRQWVWEWDATPGSHTLQVRATDRAGRTQTSERAPVAPDGATGWHSVDVTVA
ncbi:MAG: molybdopterin-dependent oxidoreductase [Nocardioidaceae bacterium]